MLPIFFFLSVISLRSFVINELFLLVYTLNDCAAKDIGPIYWSQYTPRGPKKTSEKEGISQSAGKPAEADRKKQTFKCKWKQSSFIRLVWSAPLFSILPQTGIKFIQDWKALIQWYEEFLQVQALFSDWLRCSNTSQRSFYHPSFQPSSITKGWWGFFILNLDW